MTSEVLQALIEATAAEQGLPPEVLAADLAGFLEGAARSLLATARPLALGWNDALGPSARCRLVVDERAGADDAGGVALEVLERYLPRDRPTLRVGQIVRLQPEPLEGGALATALLSPGERLGRAGEHEALRALLAAAFEVVARGLLGGDAEVEVFYNEELRAFELLRWFKVCESVSDPALEITLEAARRADSETVLGDDLGFMLAWDEPLQSAVARLFAQWSEARAVLDATAIGVGVRGLDDWVSVERGRRVLVSESWGSGRPTPWSAAREQLWARLMRVYGADGMLELMYPNHTTAALWPLRAAVPVVVVPAVLAGLEALPLLDLDELPWPRRPGLFELMEHIDALSGARRPRGRRRPIRRLPVYLTSCGAFTILHHDHGGERVVIDVFERV